MAGVETSPIDAPSIQSVELEADDGLPYRQRWRAGDVALLSVCLGVLIVAALMRVRDDQLVEFIFAPGRPLPELCQSRAVLGIPCPGCGLTRCFIHAVHGDFAAAAAANAAGLLLVLLAAIQIPYRLWMLWRPTPVVWATRDLVLVLATPVVLLWGQWAVRLFNG